MLLYNSLLLGHVSLRLALIPIALPALAACAAEGESCALPAVTAFHASTDATAVFELRDSIGVLVNGEPIPRERVGPLIAEVFATRPDSTRAVFVWAADHRCEDIRSIAALAEAAGGAAYDAGASGWPRPTQ